MYIQRVTYGDDRFFVTVTFRTDIIRDVTKWAVHLWWCMTDSSRFNNIPNLRFCQPAYFYKNFTQAVYIYCYFNHFNCILYLFSMAAQLFSRFGQLGLGLAAVGIVNSALYNGEWHFRFVVLIKIIKLLFPDSVTSNEQYTFSSSSIRMLLEPKRIFSLSAFTLHSLPSLITFALRLLTRTQLTWLFNGAFPNFNFFKSCIRILIKTVTWWNDNYFKKNQTSLELKKSN